MVAGAADANGNLYDLVVLGGGSGGYACAIRAAQLGKRVALIEENKLGGTCLHQGCIPTKALLHAAEVADTVHQADEVGVLADFNGIDMGRLNNYKDSVVSRLFTGLTSVITNAAIDVIEGRGQIVDSHTVRVAGMDYSSEYLVLATGSAAHVIDGVELGETIVTSDEALNLDYVPQSALIIGGSVIGVEFASLWRSLGTDVTIIEVADRLVPQEEKTISKQLERAFKKRKITVKTGAQVAEIDNRGSEVAAVLNDGTTVTAQIALIATGRQPNTANIGLEQAGISVSETGHVEADSALTTNLPGVYAVGDLVTGPQLAHRGFAHGIFVAEHIAGLEPAVVTDTDIPRVTYCDPNIASVGLTQAQAEAEYGKDGVQSYEYNLAGNGKSQILRTRGIVKTIRRNDGPIVGVHMIGSRFGEQIGEASLLVNWDAFPEDVASIIHAHPTQNESLGEVALALAGKPLHAPAQQRK